jgi:hypothetical protein
MGFDRFVNIVFPSVHNLRKKVILKDYIKEDFTYYPDSKVLCVLCPPWHVSKPTTAIVRHTLKRYKYSYLTYDIHPDIISPDYIGTKKYLKEIIKKMQEDIRKYDKKYKFIDIHIVGFSFGSLYAINVANKIKKISKVILITVGNSFAECLYDCISTSEMRDRLIELGISQRKYNNCLKEFNPEENIFGLKNKDVRIVISRQDQIIKYKYGLKLIQKMRKAGINPQVIVNQNQGHYGTNIKFLLHPNKFL